MGIDKRIQARLKQQDNHVTRKKVTGFYQGRKSVFVNYEKLFCG